MSNSAVVSERAVLASCKHGLKAQLLQSFRAHALFIALVLAYACATYITAAIYGVADKVRLSLYSSTLFVATFFVLGSYLIVFAVRTMVVERPQHPARYVLNSFRTRYLTRERLLTALPIFVSLPILMSAFTSFKTMLPIIKPFCWDATLARWDAALHGGCQPWQLLHPILAYPLLTCVINFIYNIWFFVMFVVLFWQGFGLGDLQLRMRFFLTFALCWIVIGTAGAIAFSSAGPCFYGRVVPGQPDIFQPLMQYLRLANESFPVWAVKTQEDLWIAYASSNVGPVNGISAMPSMHVSMAFLFALVGWRVRQCYRISCIALILFAVLIMVGCVHLGWHYAIDGYAAIPATWLIWWAVGRLLQWSGTPAGPTWSNGVSTI